MRVSPPFLALLIAGCGGGKAITYDELSNEYLNSLCKVEVSCGDMPDLATCLGSLQLDTTEHLTIKADIASGKVHYDAAKGQVCADWYARYGAAACTLNGLTAVTGDTTGSNACAYAITGTVPDGGPCFVLNECVSRRCAQTDATCVPTYQCCAGTCVPKLALIPVGADCDASLLEQICDQNAVCIVTASSPSAKCVVRSKVPGTPCIGQYECALPLACDIDAATGAGTCQPAAATGAACNADALIACESLRDYCNRTTGKCTPRGGVGATCDPLDANSCLGVAQCIGSTCVALSSERGSCDPTAGRGCLGALACYTPMNTCGFPPTAGACM